MAEVLGAVASGVTLAALFKTCIEGFNLIQTSRHQESDFKKLKLRLNIEKCRLYTWGEMMGLTDISDADQDRPIDKVRFPDVVQEILETVLELFHDSQKVKEKYGCRQTTSYDLLEADEEGPIRNLAASFSNFSIRTSQHLPASKVVQKLVWVIHDRKKFGGLVLEIKDLVDSLQDITSSNAPVARQQAKMKRKILDIQDTETLSAIAEACSEDHPDVAEAASTRAETVSLASTYRCHVVAWMEDVKDVQENEGEKLLFELESLTVTELKQKLFELLRERKGHNALPITTQDSFSSVSSTFPAFEPSEGYTATLTADFLEVPFKTMSAKASNDFQVNPSSYHSGLYTMRTESRSPPSTEHASDQSGILSPTPNVWNTRELAPELVRAPNSLSSIPYQPNYGKEGPPKSLPIELEQTQTENYKTRVSGSPISKLPRSHIFYSKENYLIYFLNVNFLRVESTNCDMTILSLYGLDCDIHINNYTDKPLNGWLHSCSVCGDCLLSPLSSREPCELCGRLSSETKGLKCRFPGCKRVFRSDMHPLTLRTMWSPFKNAKIG